MALEFGWTEEQTALRAEVVRFARDRLNEGLSERERRGAFSRAAWRHCAEFGIQGLAMPREYGGAGRDLMSTVLAMEGLGYGCRDNGLTLALNAQMWTVQWSILRFGSDAQKERYLPAMCRGEQIGSYAITEPEAGSDVYALRTTAERCADGYVLNGTKAFVSLGPVSDVVLVFAATDPEVGMWGLSCFLVDRGTPGAEWSAPQSKMGLRTVPMGTLTLRDCRVPEHGRLGAEGHGASISNHSLEWERSCMLASHLGAMQRQLEETVAYARRREQFGRPIANFQAVSHRIAEMKLRWEASRLLIYRVAWLKARGRPAALEAALAKLQVSEAFASSSLDALRIHGGRGYLSESGVECDLRDAVGGVLYGGTSDIQREVIARHLGLGTP